MGSCCPQSELRPQMRITKIAGPALGRAGPNSGLGSKHASPPAEPPHYTADGLGAAYRHFYIISVSPRAVPTRSCVDSSDSVSRCNHMRCRLGHVRVKAADVAKPCCFFTSVHTSQSTPISSINQQGRQDSYPVCLSSVPERSIMRK